MTHPYKGAWTHLHDGMWVHVVPMTDIKIHGKKLKTGEIVIGSWNCPCKPTLYADGVIAHNSFQDIQYMKERKAKKHH